MPGFIDPPSPWAPVERWEGFLKELLEAPDQGDSNWREAAKEAEEVIARKHAVPET